MYRKKLTSDSLSKHGFIFGQKLPIIPSTETLSVVVHMPASLALANDRSPSELEVTDRPQARGGCRLQRDEREGTVRVPSRAKLLGRPST